MTEKNLDILFPRCGESLQEQCQSILEQVDRDRVVLGIVFFFQATTLQEYLSGEETMTKACRRAFGMAMPMVTCIAQKPLESPLAAEVLYLNADCLVEYNEDYLVIRSDKGTELVTRGIHFPQAGDTGEQAAAVFERLRTILESEGFLVSEIIRQWNYIEGITQVHSGRQNYQLFNDARSAFYERADWGGGYPAATGIGCFAGGVTVCVYAVKGHPGPNRPIDNPIQVPAHKYSEKVLESGSQAVRTTPKFERARLLGSTVFVSGTAAIKGEDSNLSSDPGRQANAAIDVVDHLVDPANIFPGCTHFHFEALRVYIKHEEDARPVIDVIRKRWNGVPMHFLVADICREELLLELEGTGSIWRFLECCCTDAGEAIQAEKGGAGRIELCEDLPCGGVTPSADNLREVLGSVRIPVNVLIRPRGGNFVYDEREVETMISSIRLCKKLGVNGVVIGALRPDGRVDMDVTQRLIHEAQGLEVTFHRAFDECSDPFRALEDIIFLGCNRLLTAGHAANVGEGAAMLKALVEKAAGRIIILAGSGVRPANIALLEKSTGVREFHSSSHGPDGHTEASTVAKMVSPHEIS